MIPSKYHTYHPLAIFRYENEMHIMYNIIFNLFLTNSKEVLFKEGKNGLAELHRKVMWIIPISYPRIGIRIWHETKFYHPITGSWRQLVSPNINSALYMIHYLQSASDSPPNRGLFLYLGSFWGYYGSRVAYVFQPVSNHNQ